MAKMAHFFIYSVLLLSELVLVSGRSIFVDDSSEEDSSENNFVTPEDLETNLFTNADAEREIVDFDTLENSLEDSVEDVPKSVVVRRKAIDHDKVPVSGGNTVLLILGTAMCLLIFLTCCTSCSSGLQEELKLMELAYSEQEKGRTMTV